MRVSVSGRIAASIASLAIAACSLVIDTTGYVGEVPADALAPTPTSTATTTLPDGGKPPTGGPDAFAPDGAPLLRCVGLPGSTMLDRGSYCIDTTEVTQAQYQAFLASATKPTKTPECTWKNSYEPHSTCRFQPETRARQPVSGVDWCDAQAYCAWAGKRLCKLSDWKDACSRGGERAYGYGNDYVAANCNTPGFPGPAGTREVATLPQCIGGYDGLFDMIGNVSEWDDTCDVVAGSDRSKDKCYHRGGNVRFGPYDCDERELDLRGHTDDDCESGIRCCSD